MDVGRDVGKGVSVGTVVEGGRTASTVAVFNGGVTSVAGEQADKATETARNTKNRIISHRPVGVTALNYAGVSGHVEPLLLILSVLPRKLGEADWLSLGIPDKQGMPAPLKPRAVAARPGLQPL